jgi:hypothetical protein
VVAVKAIPSALRPPGLVVCGLVLAACAGCGTRVAGDADLGAAVKSHYDARAMEEGGLCRTPELNLVTSSSVQERTGDHVVVRVGYAYSDPINRASGQCRGFGTRSFTVAKTTDGFEVLEMTGLRREGIRIERIERSGWW